MSVCGSCPYPYEAQLSKDYNGQSDPCEYGCSHEDAAYRAQWAYEQLAERYAVLGAEKDGLAFENLQLRRDLGVYVARCLQLEEKIKATEDDCK